VDAVVHGPSLTTTTSCTRSCPTSSMSG
jgi:hypothetical protein